MARLEVDGTIRTSLGQVLFSDDEPTLEQIRELVSLFLKKSSGFPGGFPLTRGGSRGRQGQNGPQGPQGPALGGGGSQGAQGAQGPAGSDGPAGAPGAQGPAGPGIAGAQGAQGAAGASGAQGAQGVAGASGAQGAAGAQGTAGATGAQGAAGSTGAQGAAGAQGSAGTDGSMVNVALFSFTITSGSFSTGALGFTPLFAIYAGAATSSDIEAGDFGVSFITGAGLGNAGMVVIGLTGDTLADILSADFRSDDGTALMDPTLVASAGAGTVTNSNVGSTGLTVTNFDATQIVLDWGFLPPSIAAHHGKLLVVG